MPLTQAPLAAQAWLTLLRAPGLGGARIRTLLERFGSAQAALEAGPTGWRSVGLPAASIAWLRKVDANEVAADLAWLSAASSHLLCMDSEDFPPLLARTPNAPAALFVVGAPAALWTAQVGIVGSRNPTSGGRDNARSFTAAFAKAGLSITSGLADGVDAEAHRTALNAKAITIAVMGTGPDLIYPAVNRELAHAIVDSGGALVSEFPPGISAKREHFPRRNRIIAGLSLGVVVIEAGLQSGALITARLAAEAGREVFAVPGSIHNPMARGCHRLIREGVALVESANEVLEALAPAARELGGLLADRLQQVEPATPGTPVSGDAEDALRERLWDALGHDPVAIDALAERTGLTVEDLSAMLLLLELEGRVAVSHGRYARQG
ncbi:MAG: DNA-processing protein DprA [Pseudomarimonas sp.]